MPGEILPPTLYYMPFLQKLLCFRSLAWRKNLRMVWRQIGNALNLESRINYDWMIAYRRPFISFEKFIRKSVPIFSKEHIKSVEIFMDLQNI